MRRETSADCNGKKEIVKQAFVSRIRIKKTGLVLIVFLISLESNYLNLAS